MYSDASADAPGDVWAAEDVIVASGSAITEEGLLRVQHRGRAPK